MASAAPSSLSPVQMRALEMVTQGTNKFTISLYKAVTKNQSGNVFVSPLSAQVVLALAYTGAKGETASEIAKVLSLPDIMDATFTGYNSLIKTLENPVLKIANRMFVDTTLSVKPEFQKNSQEHFIAPAESVDFSKNPEGSCKQINTWVENQTNKKIIDILSAESITPDTKVVLVNAIHFKDNWFHKFLEADTKQMPFHLTKSKSTPVQMMHAEKEFGFLYDKELQAKFLNLAYESRGFHMLVVLPDEIEGLVKFETKLETVDLVGKVRNMQEHTVTVEMPKFKMEETLELSDLLMALGVRAMFDVQTADFSGLSDNKNVVVTKVAQKTFVEVNEKGTEAAAATYVIVADCIPSKPQTFIADHPFLFMILHYQTPIFIGRFNNPSPK